MTGIDVMFRNILPPLAKDSKIFRDGEVIYTKDDSLFEFTNPFPKRIKVSTFQDLPFSGTDNRNGTLVGVGWAFHILDILADKLKFSYDVVLPKDQIIGNKTHGIISQLVKGEVDLACAFLPILPHLQEKVISYSTFLDEGEMTLMMRRPPESATGTGPFAPFSIQVWLLFVVAMCIMSPILVAVIWLRSKFPSGAEPEVFGLWDALWFCYSGLFKQGTPFNARTDTTRLLFTSWWLFSTVIAAFYTGNLTAVLTRPNFTLEINSLEDLNDENQEWFSWKGKTVEYMLNEGNTELKQLKRSVRRGNAHFLDQCEVWNDSKIQITNLIMNKDWAFFGDRSFIQNIMIEDYYNKTRAQIHENLRCTFVVVPSNLFAVYRAFGFPLGSKLVPRINKYLGHMEEDGLIRERKRSIEPYGKVCPLVLYLKERQLSCNDLLSTLRFMYRGYCAGAALLGAEIVFHFFICGCRKCGLFKCCRCKSELPKVEGKKKPDAKLVKKNSVLPVFNVELQQDIFNRNNMPPPAYPADGNLRDRNIAFAASDPKNAPYPFAP